jgi:chromate transporter
MILATLFGEFFKIGLFAVGGGLVTIPFLFELTKKYNWFTAQELMDMIAVSQSTPGPVGINMATYAGFKAASFEGGITATFGLVLPSLIIVILVSRLLNRYSENAFVWDIMTAIRPAGIALILHAGIELFTLSAKDYFSVAFVFCFFVLIYFYKKSPVFYIILSAVLGVVLKL